MSEENVKTETNISEVSLLMPKCELPTDELAELKERLQKMYIGKISPESRLNGYSILIKAKNKRLDELRAELVNLREEIAGHICTIAKYNADHDGLRLMIAKEANKPKLIKSVLIGSEHPKGPQFVSNYLEQLSLNINNFIGSNKGLRVVDIKMIREDGTDRGAIILYEELSTDATNGKKD